MTAYKTVVVGTDGSESSLRAVDRAAKIAAESNAKLIIATGYFTQTDDKRAADVLGDEAYKVQGNAPIYAMLHDARDRAKAAGAKNIEDRPIQVPRYRRWWTSPRRLGPTCWWSAMWDWTRDRRSSGGVFSIPGAVATRAKIDVLIVRTSG